MIDTCNPSTKEAEAKELLWFCFVLFRGWPGYVMSSEPYLDTKRDLSFKKDIYKYKYIYMHQSVMKLFKRYLCMLLSFIVNPPFFFLSVHFHFALTFWAQGPFLPCVIVSTPTDRYYDLLHKSLLTVHFYGISVPISVLLLSNIILMLSLQ